ncbi:hypothetical protein SEA_ALTADENA_61 [Arthrobacter phage Altadena]|uniref:Uncharacterized protein n=1 Tax=Arthrobacter phage Altadena TaxID=3059064 RepID=A0AA96HT95_9CAUD|nr:hypothetical protein SEA_ALTADENA_61 [Arthrobacter phage Altadena]
MNLCANCEEPIVRTGAYGAEWWVHPGEDRRYYLSRCVVEGPFRGLRAEPAVTA